MKRLIIKTPETTQLDELSEQQKNAIKSVFAQWVMPMPGTQVSNGYKLIDAVVSDNFNLDAITDLALPFEIIGMWQWLGSGSLIEHQPLDVSFIDFLPDIPTFDSETREILFTTPAVLHEPHRWSGWPEIEL